MVQGSVRRRLYAGLALLVLVALGCGKGPPKQPAERAEAVVEQFLDAWSRGDTPEQFAAAGRPVEATDPDWRAGCRLLSFLAAESRQGPDGPDHFRCRFALSLRDRKGRKVDKQVVYDVKLGEKSVIARAPR
jgi:hypothetical protein